MTSNLHHNNLPVYEQVECKSVYYILNTGPSKRVLSSLSGFMFVILEY